MGGEVRAAVEVQPELELGGALEAPGHPGLGSELENTVVVCADAKQAFSGCDVAIDFSVPVATLANLRTAADQGTAYVTGTTGFDAAGSAEIASLAERIPVIHAANFSVAVNVLAWLVREASARLGPDYDAEILEIHHGRKRDAPSGTALQLAQAVAEGRGVTLSDHIVTAREGETGVRPAGAIGVQALRGGDIAGEHTVMLIGAGERLELIHRSSTRGHFARGAVRAAAWLVGREPGLYPLERVLALER
jgi:4-hydroxy-tetrahydrodipicolinate reductase